MAVYEALFGVVIIRLKFVVDFDFIIKTKWWVRFEEMKIMLKKVS